VASRACLEEVLVALLVQKVEVVLEDHPALILKVELVLIPGANLVVVVLVLLMEHLHLYLGDQRLADQIEKA
jgi:hypothetical protein